MPLPALFGIACAKTGTTGAPNNRSSDSANPDAQAPETRFDWRLEPQSDRRPSRLTSGPAVAGAVTELRAGRLQAVQPVLTSPRPKQVTPTPPRAGPHGISGRFEYLMCSNVQKRPEKPSIMFPAPATSLPLRRGAGQSPRTMLMTGGSFFCPAAPASALRRGPVARNHCPCPGRHRSAGAMPAAD